MSRASRNGQGFRPCKRLIALTHHFVEAAFIVNQLLYTNSISVPHCSCPLLAWVTGQDIIPDAFGSMFKARYSKSVLGSGHPMNVTSAEGCTRAGRPQYSRVTRRSSDVSTCLTLHHGFLNGYLASTPSKTCLRTRCASVWSCCSTCLLGNPSLHI